MDINTMIKLAQKELPKDEYHILPRDDNYQSANTIAAYLSNIELILQRLESSELALYDNNYILSLKEKIQKLKQTFSSFKRSSDSGKGYFSLRQKLKILKQWLIDYNNQTNDPTAKALLSDFTRISNIFDNTLPSTFSNLEERVDDVLEYGNLFVKNVNSFILMDEDVDLTDVLKADDFEDENIELPKKDIPKKVLASMVKTRQAYRKFLDRINSQIQEILSLLDDLEAIEFPQLLEQFNARNKYVKELMRLFSGISGNIRTNLKRRNDAKLEYAEMFEPGFFEHYRTLLKRAAKFLPEGLATNLLREMNLAKMSRIMQNSLVESRTEKLSPKESLEDLSNSDKTKSAKFSILDSIKLQASFAEIAGKKSSFSKI